MLFTHLLLPPSFSIFPTAKTDDVSPLAVPRSCDLSRRESRGVVAQCIWGGTWALGNVLLLEELIPAWSLSAGTPCCLEMTFSPLQHSSAADDLNSPSPSLSGDRKAPAVLEMRQMLMELWFQKHFSVEFFPFLHRTAQCELTNKCIIFFFPFLGGFDMAAP